ncbi:hypothetical protein V8D89_008402 [Ganoderma adspersum]
MTFRPDSVDDGEAASVQEAASRQKKCFVVNNLVVWAASIVRQRRNPLARINFLLGKVLLRILFEATRNRPHSKINVLLTCSRWRNVCYSDLPFWGRFLVASSVLHALRTIATAQGRSLDLTIDFKTWSTGLQKVVSQRGSTVRCLTARMTSSIPTFGRLTD